MTYDAEFDRVREVPEMEAEDVTHEQAQPMPGNMREATSKRTGQYDAFAQDFERHAETSAFNAYYDRPALLSLLGEVAGKRVLDVGCGPGLHASELVARGAIVTAFDETMDWRKLGGSYFAVEVVEETWRKNWHVRYWRQPLERWCDEFAQAGFVIESLVEPRPVHEMEDTYPNEYQHLMTQPGFIAFRLAKSPFRSGNPTSATSS